MLKHVAPLAVFPMIKRCGNLCFSGWGLSKKRLRFQDTFSNPNLARENPYSNVLLSKNELTSEQTLCELYCAFWLFGNGKSLKNDQTLASKMASSISFKCKTYCLQTVESIK